jgi:hypothetical protein
MEVDLDSVINELEKLGFKSDIDPLKFQTKGLGTIVESVLNKFGVTKEGYRDWFNLEECDCDKRKQWLNQFFSWQNYS